MIHLFPTRQVALELFGFSVHWYGIMYMVAFLLSYELILRLQNYRSLRLSREDVASILSYGIVGVIVGGRLGYVVFYEPLYFLSHPLEILSVWNGGMASHGGFLGVGIALLIVLRRKEIPLLPFLDLIVVPAALGLALGRIGNFINWELYGSVTTVPWAMAIPGVEGLRHPTFFYAFAKDICIALVCFLHLRSGKRIPGETFAVFLTLYAVLRFVVEFYRVQQHPLIDFGSVALTRGQLLTVPFLIVGITLLLFLQRKR